MDKDPSVLDGVMVDDKAFPLRPAAEKRLEITGHCPHCGAPIYGCPRIPFDTVPVVTYACTCWRRSGLVAQQLETKEH